MAPTRAKRDERPSDTPVREADGSGAEYRLDAQIGFLLRQADQRHRAIFSRAIGADVTPRQWAALAKLSEAGSSAQNLLGRRTAMDAATIKGVVDRLCARKLVTVATDDTDGRRRTIALTGAGARLVRDCMDAAYAITQDTMAPLSRDEQAMLLTLLAKIS